MRRVPRAALIATGVALVAGAAAIWAVRFAPRHVPAGQRALAELHDPELLRQAFNAAADHTRVLALLSPT